MNPIDIYAKIKTRSPFLETGVWMTRFWLLSEAEVVVSGWWLLVPLAMFVFPFGISFWLSTKWWPQLKAKLAHRRLYRSIVAVAPALLFGLVVPGALDRPLAEEIFRHRKVLEGYTWNLSLVAGCAAIFAWSQLVIYWFGDSATEEARTDRELLEATKHYAAFNLGIARAFLTVVSFKAGRVASFLARQNGHRFSATQLKSVLSPTQQKEGLITAVHSIYNNNVGAGHTTRVTLYELDGELLTPRLMHEGTIIVRQPKFSDYKDKLSVAVRQSKCLPVEAARTGKVQIVPNAQDCHKDPEHAFCWLRSHIEDRTESAVAIPLLEDGDKLPASRVLYIETDRPNFFRDTMDDQKQLALLAENVKSRLLFEVNMAKLLSYL